ncbi:MAG TPA: peroxide stress protein YaaA [Terrimesophilobacter sp.]|nr:peroxide stress protein YaaA [Terrimesophilobacter sp.]HRQ00241.1 peroxide stress protein YaaA [Terrimesophilobacter sp.]
MLILLPPSESKRDGGPEGSSLDLDSLGFAELSSQRRAVLASLRLLSRNRAASLHALGLSEAQGFEVDRNRTVRSSPVLPAIERYTGVLFDGLDWARAADASREFARGHVAIHSALFGLVRAGDLIPAYRLSHDSRLSVRGHTLKALWREPVAGALAKQEGLVLDLRSEAYVAMGPAPAGSVFLRVVTEGTDGRRRALNHFNKKAKGEFTRALIDARIDHSSVDSLLEWAADASWNLSRGASHELDLLV